MAGPASLPGPGGFITTRSFGQIETEPRSLTLIAPPHRHDGMAESMRRREVIVLLSIAAAEKNDVGAIPGRRQAMKKYNKINYLESKIGAPYGSVLSQ